jgi:hypothetical protein
VYASFSFPSPRSFTDQLLDVLNTESTLPAAVNDCGQAASIRELEHAHRRYPKAEGNISRAQQLASTNLNHHYNLAY